MKLKYPEMSKQKIYVKNAYKVLAHHRIQNPYFIFWRKFRKYQFMKNTKFFFGE